MEKRKVNPSPVAEPIPSATESAPSAMADALTAQAETNLVALRVANLLKEQLLAGMSDQSKALQDVVNKITATREVSVEVTRRDADGRIKTLRVRSSIPSSSLH